MPPFTKYVNNLRQDIFTLKFSIKNSLELTHALQHLNIQNSYKLVSFDGKHIFPSIPVSDLKIILEKRINSNIIDPSRNSHIRQLLDLCLNQNYFIFNNKYYEQQEGLPMDSPISPVLSKIYISHLEQSMLNPINPHFKHIVFWRRYVDDIFVI